LLCACHPLERARQYDGVTDLALLAADISWPDHDAATRAHDSIASTTAFGALGALAEWVSGVQAHYPPRSLVRPRLIIFASDHGIAEAGVSAYPPGMTTQLIAEVRDWRAMLSALAEVAGAGVRIVELGIESQRIDAKAALTDQQVSDAIAVGAATADEEIDAGGDFLIAANLGIASTTSAAALIAVLTGTEPVKVVGRGGSGIDDTRWMHKVSAIRDARLRGWPYRDDPAQLLASCGGADIAALSGFLLQAAARRTPVLLDGAVTAAAAVLAGLVQPRASRWWQAAQRTGEPAQTLALARLGLEPILDLGMTVGDGSGGLLALNLLRSAIAAMVSQVPPGLLPDTESAQSAAQ